MNLYLTTGKKCLILQIMELVLVSDKKYNLFGLIGVSL
jgi:hypothetical protein